VLVHVLIPRGCKSHASWHCFGDRMSPSCPTAALLVLLLWAARQRLAVKLCADITGQST